MRRREETGKNRKEEIWIYGKFKIQRFWIVRNFEEFFFRYGILGFGRIDQIELQFQTQTKTK